MALTGDIVTAILGALGAVEEPAPVLRAEQPPPVLDVPAMLDLMDLWLEPLVLGAPELAAARSIIAAARADPDPASAPPTMIEYAVEESRVTAGFAMVVTAGPVVAKLIDLARPERYLPSFADVIAVETARIRRLYSAAILTELRSPVRGPAGVHLVAADRAMAAFPVFVRDRYLDDLRGCRAASPTPRPPGPACGSSGRSWAGR
ncbi:hypothetical protein Asp14428_21210 [Actinoplanes sp. NBRC 14428]|nr:hypothetical protein Asp14428_21210 [Actinoplanes sp. NBRC 14428]